MALTVEQLAKALHIDAMDAHKKEQLMRMLDNAKAEIERYAPNAPDTAKEEAAIRVIGYREPGFLHPGQGYANAFLNSGAAAILRLWRVSKGVAI